MNDKYTAKRTFNNNIVFCIDDENNRECILVGKGLGFAIKEGMNIKNVEMIEKVFYLVDTNNKDRFIELSKEVDNDIIAVTEEIIAMACKELKKELDEKIHVTFLDHVAFAVERYQNGIDIRNPFLSEIRVLYKEEYTVALKMLTIINQRLNIKLPEDEVGFISMHLHAALNMTSVTKTTLDAEVMNKIVGCIEDGIGITIDKDSFDFIRLVTHIKFALDRIHRNISIENLLLDDIKRKFKISYKVSKEISQKIKNEFNISLSEDEIGYLAIHIEKIRSSRQN